MASAEPISQPASATSTHTIIAFSDGRRFVIRQPTEADDIFDAGKIYVFLPDGDIWVLVGEGVVFG